ncbi:hypothetical protein, partial [Staphylococcus pettenkoferi]|uniref:hypothetical protein n=1 Tax=Staphylococcus pettenkoferi TaxID=170573 RepID=UPI0016429CE9
RVKMYECGLRKEMGLEVFKGLVMKEVVEGEMGRNIKNGKSKIEGMEEEVWDVVEDVMKEEGVVLKGGGRLERVGIEGLEARLVEGGGMGVERVGS